MLLSDRWNRWTWLLLLLAMFSVVMVPGCGGCWNSDDSIAKKKEEEEAEKKKKKKKIEKPKPNFEMPVASVLPNDPNIRLMQDAEEGNAPGRDKMLQISRVKPGHWAAVSQVARANNYDFIGELRSSAVDTDSQALDIEHTNFRISSSRPASLPKGQTRAMETFFYLPRRTKNYGTYTLMTSLYAADGGSQQLDVRMGGSVMKEHEFFFVVLAANPSAYTYVDRLESIALGVAEPGQDAFLTGGGRFYDVSLPRVDRRAPLPSHPLAWTTVAFIVWDDVNPAVLTQEQQQAMIDWLHWGGQLIVSGPNSLDKLKGSFLEPYLPAKSAATTKYDQAALDELSESWSLKSKVDGGKPRTIRISEQLPLIGVELALNPSSNFVPKTGNLVAERRVGGGRTAVTAFSLTDLRIVKWKGFDNFFNSALLRRPGRQFAQSQLGELQMKWANKEYGSLSNDPRLVSTLRYFTRDVGYLPIDSKEEQLAIVAATPQLSTTTPPVSAYDELAEVPEQKPTNYHLHPDVDDWHFNGYHASPQSGVAGWNDFSAAAESSRKSLVEAAGVKIPRADFVLKTLAIYLAVLVPLNWFVFWMIGRVEWAWFAAPVIAIIGALGVVRLAQLDIGFVRSRTEIAVLELQGNHPRGHLTRYIALYTSLATRYRLTFDDANALALPFSDDPRYDRPFTKTPTDAVLRRDETIALENVQVPSNSTVLVHSEQMLPLGGGITIGGDAAKGLQVFNRTSLALREAGVLRKTDSGALEVAYLGDLKSQSAAPVRFEPASDPKSPRPSEWDKSFVMSSSIERKNEDKGKVRLFRLVQLASERLRLNPGDMRLVAWTDEDLPGLEVSPVAPQTSSYTLVVAHLTRGQLPAPESDNNIADDYKNGIDPDEPDPLQQTPPTGDMPDSPEAAAPPATPTSTASEQLTVNSSQ
jgi:hypothetical protein